MENSLRNCIFGSCAIALVSCFPASADPLPPAESDAFIRTYSFEVLKAGLNEGLALGVQNGRLTRKDAECAISNFEWDELLSVARPAVSNAFKSSDELRAATLFFASPTGKKFSAWGAETLSISLQAQARGERPQPAPPIPPSFTPRDVELAAAFGSSRAGQAFARFVREEMPKLTKTNLLQSALAKCKSNK